MPRSAEPMPPEIWAQVSRFQHLFMHLRLRQRGLEPTLFPDCWEIVWTGGWPEWAETLADAGEPGWQWCPILRPELRARV